MKLSGNVALVTGGARGLGAEYARRLASLGADVAIIDIDLRSYEAFADEARQFQMASLVDQLEAQGVRTLALETDVTDDIAVTRAVADIEAEMGPVTILVANAGGSTLGVGPSPPASQLSAAEVRQVVERNLYSTMFTCSAVAPSMKRLRRGKIVTVSSDAGLFPTVDGSIAHYGAAKAAVITYTQYLAAELGPYNITVNAIAPGYIGTGRLMTAFREMGVEDITGHIALRRIGTPEDCARVVEFLTTDASDYVTGAVIEISPRIG
jgi:3-oxoacyl-[acyl-carrier protein] reductase